MAKDSEKELLAKDAEKKDDKKKLIRDEKVEEGTVSVPNKTGRKENLSVVSTKLMC